LVPIENTDALADAILQLLADPQLRRKMGAAARKKVLDLYTADRMCEQYLALMFK
ncbi:glycosyltransferase, partial [bacterium]|nr:glycosyltransferase [bacterium]